MPTHMVRKGFVASTRRFIVAIFVSIIGAVVLALAIDELVAKILTATMRRSRYFASMDVPTFHQSRYPLEVGIATFATLLITVYGFTKMYVFSPALCVLPSTSILISLTRVTDFSTRSFGEIRQNNFRSCKKTLRLNQQHQSTQIPGMMMVDWTIQLLRGHPVDYNTR